MDATEAQGSCTNQIEVEMEEEWERRGKTFAFAAERKRESRNKRMNESQSCLEQTR
jgi:hypothetical protein